ncbi:hypothetical protein PP180_10410 [Muricauda sp. SK9]|nr:MULTISPECIES: hypothetical protein [Allomuricauda]MDC6385781.1 hypothetical protein [Muricauda sp. SK9]
MFYTPKAFSFSLHFLHFNRRSITPKGVILANYKRSGYVRADTVGA